MPFNPVIIVAGPTASGKSALALDIAEALNGAVVNADAMQVYRDTPVLSACPTAEDKARVPHYLYEIYEADYSGSVADWLEAAVQIIRKLWQEGKVPVVTGGTGLYIDNLLNGASPIPETSDEIKKQVAVQLAAEGVRALHRKLNEVDAETAARLSPNDTTRVRRAWEVYLSTGMPLSEWHRRPMVKKLPEAEFLVIKIAPGVAELDRRCYQRFDMMLNGGAIDEARRLKARGLSPRLPAMKALGVPEIMDYLDGKSDYETMNELGKLHTRQYAKRQRTWFGNKLNADLILPGCYDGSEKIINDVKKMYKLLHKSSFGYKTSDNMS